MNIIHIHFHNSNMKNRQDRLQQDKNLGTRQKLNTWMWHMKYKLMNLYIEGNQFGSLCRIGYSKQYRYRWKLWKDNS